MGWKVVASDQEFARLFLGRTVQAVGDVGFADVGWTFDDGLVLAMKVETHEAGDGCETCGYGATEYVDKTFYVKE